MAIQEPNTVNVCLPFLDSAIRANRTTHVFKNVHKRLQGQDPIQRWKMKLFMLVCFLLLYSFFGCVCIRSIGKTLLTLAVNLTIFIFKIHLSWHNYITQKIMVTGVQYINLASQRHVT